MRRGLVTVALVLLALLAGWAWLHFVHDPAVRRVAQLHARDAMVDSLVTAYRDSAAAWGERERARVAALDSLAAEAARLRARQPEVVHVVDEIVREVPDTALVRRLMAGLARERATADSARRVDSLRIGELEVLAAGRLALLRQAEAAVDSLEAMRDAWREEAGRRWPVGVGCTLGPAAGTRGLEPLAVACGVTLRVW